MTNRNFDGLNATLIHQLKKKIEELNEEKEKLQTIFDSANDGILIADIKSKRFYYGNKAICRMTGYNLDELKNRGILDIHPKKDLPYVLDQFKKQAMKKIDVAKEIPVKRKNGEVFYVDINSSPITISGKAYLLGIFRDITEKKKAEEALRNSEWKYRILIENAGDLIYLIGRNYNVLSLNSAAARLWGKKPEEIVGKSIFGIFPKDIASHYSSSLKRVFEKGKSMASESEMAVGGRKFWISANLNPIKDNEGKVIAVMGITRDITERKRIEDALRESEEKFRAIFENAGEGILVADAKTKKLTLANQAICKILGYKEKELLKLKVNDIHPKKDLPHVMEQFKKQLQKKMLTANLPVLRKDRKVIFCNITATPLIIKGKECIAGFFLKK